MNEKSRDHFIDEIVDIAFFATQIPLSIFTNLFHQRFEKHSMLESTLEIFQQFLSGVVVTRDCVSVRRLFSVIRKVSAKVNPCAHMLPVA